ncbi:MAG: ATP-dependent DNA helicase RecG [Rhodoluna sp.]
MLLPQTPLNRLLGEKTAKALAKSLSLVTAADLLMHYPRRYSARGELTKISGIPVGETATLIADVVDVTERRMKGKAGHILEVKITDGEGFVTATFFNQAWRKQKLAPGTRGLWSGKIGSYNNKLQLSHPDYALFNDEIEDDVAKAWAELPIPIYPASSSCTTWMIQRSIKIVLDGLETLQDEIPQELTQGMLSIDQAIRQIHQPKNLDEAHKALERLKFQEAFMLQATLTRSRLLLKHQQSTVREARPGGLLEKFDSALPFTLTAKQVVSGNEIAKDLASGHPMNRLLQGEVGAGKTLVAVRAMLTVAESDGQAALLAPTEVLASQHYQSILKTIGPELAKELGLTLLTGQLNAADRKSALLAIISGKAKIIVGTHALIAEKVEFYDLGLIVIDEQHRFGVEQREALRLKGKSAPHVLTMTATPIPRTRAVTVFGDLDISVLDQLPNGRKPIASHVITVDQPNLVARVWQRVREEVTAGRQVFVVCPRIDEKDDAPDIEQLPEDGKPKRPLASAVLVAEELKANPILKDLRIGLLHGRQSAETKAEVMTKFTNREIDILVSTTVIEVGVDIPNATTMVILDADRFGISQLHQLRGRVGRGEHPGLALMLTSAEEGSLALERVKAVAETSDGFKLSEIDLEIRREGDVLGASQSGGRSSLKLLRVLKDQQLIQDVRTQVLSLFQNDPTLEKHPLLALSLEQIDKQRADFLTKA